MKPCPHGHTAAHDDTFDLASEISDCCGARVSIGDGGYYCKCCYGSVHMAL